MPFSAEVLVGLLGSVCGAFVTYSAMYRVFISREQCQSLRDGCKALAIAQHESSGDKMKALDERIQVLEECIKRLETCSRNNWTGIVAIASKLGVTLPGDQIR